MDDKQIIKAVGNCKHKLTKKKKYCLTVLEILTACNSTGKDKQAIESSP